MAALAVSGCALEDATLPSAPLEALAAAPGTLAADSTTDDDDLVCEWGPVEGQDGVWELVCYKEEASGDAAGEECCAGIW